MKFRNASEETQRGIETVGLILSLGAIFFQIWVLATSLEAHLAGHDHRLLAYTIFSFISFLVCALSAWSTGLQIMKGSQEGRSTTYHKKTKFKS
jgi:hypothetical protein